MAGLSKTAAAATTTTSHDSKILSASRRSRGGEEGTTVRPPSSSTNHQIFVAPHRNSNIKQAPSIILVSKNDDNRSTNNGSILLGEDITHHMASSRSTIMEIKKKGAENFWLPGLGAPDDASDLSSVDTTSSLYSLTTDSLCAGYFQKKGIPRLSAMPMVVCHHSNSSGILSMMDHEEDNQLALEDCCVELNSLRNMEVSTSGPQTGVKIE